MLQLSFSPFPVRHPGAYSKYEPQHQTNPKPASEVIYRLNYATNKTENYPESLFMNLRCFAAGKKLFVVAIVNLPSFTSALTHPRAPGSQVASSLLRATKNALSLSLCLFRHKNGLTSARKVGIPRENPLSVCCSRLQDGYSDRELLKQRH